MTSFDAIGFGGLNVDRIFKVNKIATAEEECFVIDFAQTCGGSAANTIVGLARLDHKVGLIGKLADDTEGNMMLEAFHRENVDTGGIIIAKHGRSGIAMSFVDKKGERAIYVDPGVNDTIGFNEIDKEYTFKTKYLHLTSFVGEQSLQTQKKLVEILPADITLSLDPGELYARKAIALEPIIAKTSVLMPNAKELQLLTGKTDYRKGAEILLKKGVEVAAIKLGNKGCYVTDGNESHLIKAFSVKVVDTTGAGDAFCAGFIHGLINGRSLYECGRIGNLVASKSIMKIGTRDGLPTLADFTGDELD